jgi:[ribosomal protein S18]-alanine N-acetyltransferase
MKPLTGGGAADTRGVHERSALASDLAALVALDRLCFGPQAWPASAWSEVVGETGWSVVVLTSGAAVVAVSVLLVSPPSAHLASLAVHPAWRRRGLAAHLVQRAVAQARGSARWLALEVDRDNRGARRLYLRHGFLPTRRFLEDGRWRLEMVRRVVVPRRRAARG